MELQVCGPPHRQPPPPPCLCGFVFGDVHKRYMCGPLLAEQSQIRKHTPEVLLLTSLQWILALLTEGRNGRMSPAMAACSKRCVMPPLYDPRKLCGFATPKSSNTATTATCFFALALHSSKKLCVSLSLSLDDAVALHPYVA